MKSCMALPLLAVWFGFVCVVHGSPASERTVDQKLVQLLTRLSEHKTIDGAVNEVRKADADQMKRDGQREQLVGRKEYGDRLQNIAELKRKPVPNMLENHENQLKRNKDGNKNENSLGNSEKQLLLREIHNILENKRQDVNSDGDKVTITQAGGSGEIQTVNTLLTVDSGDSIAVQCDVILDSDSMPSVQWLSPGTTISQDSYLLSPDSRYYVQYTQTENIVTSVLRIQGVTHADEGEYSCQAMDCLLGSCSVHVASIVISVRGNDEQQLKKKNIVLPDDKYTSFGQFEEQLLLRELEDIFGIVFPSNYRVDGRCGPDYPGPNGEEGICIADGIYPCCSTFGWCGETIEHCETYLYRDFRTDLPSNYRVDGRCGPDYPGPNGEEGVCLADGIYPCCSTGGWCGNTVEHCETYLYRDFRTDLPSNYRVDGRCGPDYPGPDGEEGVCLGNWIYPCCSTFGWCGNTVEHCATHLYRDFRTTGMTDLTGQTAGQVRLVDGSNANEGRVEIFENGAWGTVCDDGWGVGDATVVCRQLGLPEGNVEATSSAHFGQGEGAILLDDVSCTGDESQLSQCTHRGLGIHDCGHHEDAGVICGDVNNDGDKVTITQAGGAGEIKTIKLLTVDSGDNIALQCNVIFHDDSLPIQIPTVLWIARGTTILYDDHMLSPDLRYTFQYTGTENTVSSVLRIQGVTSEDEGEYRCQVLEFDNSVHGTSIVISVRDGKK